MSTEDAALGAVLGAVADAQQEGVPATPELIAERCGLGVEEAKRRLAEAQRQGLVDSVSSSEETSPPTAPTWTLTAEGYASIEPNGAKDAD